MDSVPVKKLTQDYSSIGTDSGGTVHTNSFAIRNIGLTRLVLLLALGLLVTPALAASGSPIAPPMDTTQRDAALADGQISQGEMDGLAKSYTECLEASLPVSASVRTDTNGSYHYRIRQHDDHSRTGTLSALMSGNAASQCEERFLSGVEQMWHAQGADRGAQLAHLTEVAECVLERNTTAPEEASAIREGAEEAVNAFLRDASSTAPEAVDTCLDQVIAERVSAD